MLYKFCQCAETPWKNGHGSTFQRYIYPLEANLENFDIRISMAKVQTHGPFSLFSQIDRHLVILEGDGLRLMQADDPETILINSSSPLFSFKGELSINSQLINSTVVDFNVMVRRGVFQAKVSRHHLATGNLPALPGELMVLFLANATYQDETTESHSITQYDLLATTGDEINHWHYISPTPVLLIQIQKVIASTPTLG